MKRYVLIVMLIVSLIVLGGCKVDDSDGQGGASQGGGQAVANAPNVNGTPAPSGFQFQATIDPTAAASFRQVNQLAVGILYLQGTSTPITKDQAVALLPLFKALDVPPATPEPGQTPQPRRGFALNTQLFEENIPKIQAVLTADQLSAINNLSQNDTNATMQKYGLGNRLGFGGGQGAGPGAGTFEAFATQRAEGTPFPTRDPNMIATFRAQNPAGQPRGGGNALFQAVITQLESIAGG